MDRLTKYTTSDEWSRIVLTSRSPLTLNIADPRVEFIALDFTKSPEELVKRMKVICTDVTHAYFSSYVHKGNFKESNMASKSLFVNFLEALLCHRKFPNLYTSDWRKVLQCPHPARAVASF